MPMLDGDPGAHVSELPGWPGRRVSVLVTDERCPGFPGPHGVVVPCVVAAAEPARGRTLPTCELLDPADDDLGLVVGWRAFHSSYLGRLADFVTPTGLRLGVTPDVTG